MATHTAGEWEAIGRAIFAGNVELGCASHPRDTEECPDGRFPQNYDECIANARLMAAAPKLLAALRSAAATFREYEVLHLAKSPPDESKAARNRQHAEACEAAIAAASAP